MLRDYQQAAVDAAINWIKYKRDPALLVLPTGSGKSHVIASIAEWAQTQNMRVAILAHRKELLAQNASKLTSSFGIYSAGLGGDDLDSDITIAGIQSIYNKDFKPYNLILIDEAHRVSNNKEIGQYWKFINKSPDAILLGLTATPYRLDGGKLSWGEIIYDIPHALLEGEKYLAPITNKVKATLDLSKIKLVAGEYDEAMLAEYMSDPALIEAAVKNIIAYSADRDSVLIFCVTVAHGELLVEAMKRNGLQSFLVSGKTSDIERENAILDFRAGKLKYLLNCQIFIEGFDATNIDMIVDTAPTKSKARHEQKLGRGVRLHDGKENCLLIDMAGNLVEHGGIGSPYHEKSKKEKLQPKGKICPQCEEFTKPTERVCPDCSFTFPEPEARKADHKHEADISSGAVFNPLETYKVTDVIYREHRNKANGNISLRVDYVCPLAKYGVFSEWLSVFHENDWVRNKAYKFFEERGNKLGSDTKDYSMDDLLFHTAKLKKPIEIVVDISEKFPRVKTYKYGQQPVQQTIDEALDGDIIMF